LRDYLINARCGLNLQNTLVINNAIDLQAVEKKAMDHSAARQFLRLPETGYVIGTVGRSVKGKRQMELLKAFHQFAANRADVYLGIIGDGELHRELETYVFDHGLEKKVFLPGQVPDAVRYLRALDLFVFPSEHEGFGMALLEAMALGLPVVVNRVEPLQSILDDNRFVVDTSDTGALTDMLNYCYEMGSSALTRCGHENARRTADVYGISTYRQSYFKLVESHFA
jgi:glycosyltransferase involved in cell wall biosynthesis